MKKNKKTIAAGATAITLAITAVTVPLVGNESIEVDYKLTEESEYVTVMQLDVPEDLSVDIAELYVNDAYVDKTILPTENELRSTPIVFSDPENLEVRLYKLGKCIGVAKLGKEAIK